MACERAWASMGEEEKQLLRKRKEAAVMMATAAGLLAPPSASAPVTLSRGTGPGSGPTRAASSQSPGGSGTSGGSFSLAPQNVRLWLDLEVATACELVAALCMLPVPASHVRLVHLDGHVPTKGTKQPKVQGTGTVMQRTGDGPPTAGTPARCPLEMHLAQRDMDPGSPAARLAARSGAVASSPNAAQQAPSPSPVSSGPRPLVLRDLMPAPPVPAATAWSKPPRAWQNPLAPRTVYFEVLSRPRWQIQRRVRLPVRYLGWDPVC